LIINVYDVRAIALLGPCAHRIWKSLLASEGQMSAVGVRFTCSLCPKAVVSIVFRARLPPYIYKVYSPFLRTLCKETQNLAFLLNIFLKKACLLLKNVLPLHPLSGTKSRGIMKEFIERFT